MKLAADGQTEPFSRSQTYFTLTILMLAHALANMDRIVMAALTPFLKRDLDLSDSEIGFIVGIGFSLFYSLFGLPLARVADRSNRKNLIAISLLVWSAMTALTGLAQNFIQLFLARISVGIGEAGCMPASHSVICDCIGPERRASAFSVYAVGGYIGTALGLSLGGWLGSVIGWRWTFLVFAVPGIALAGFVRLFLTEPPRGSLDQIAVPISNPRGFRPFYALCRQRPFVLLLIFLTANAFVASGTLQWWPSFYERSHPISASQNVAYLGLVIGSGSAAGLLAGGFGMNLLVDTDRKISHFLGAASILISGFVMAGALLVDSVNLSLFLVGVSGFLWCFPNGPVLATLHGSVTPDMRASAIALALLLAAIFGGGFGPLFVGFLSDSLSQEYGTNSLRMSLIALVVMTPLVVLPLYKVAKI